MKQEKLLPSEVIKEHFTEKLGFDTDPENRKGLGTKFVGLF